MLDTPTIGGINVRSADVQEKVLTVAQPLPRVADLIVEKLAEAGVNHCFLVTGGGAMYLNDAFGADPDISTHHLHHEQACAMAAEAQWLSSEPNNASAVLDAAIRTATTGRPSFGLNCTRLDKDDWRTDFGTFLGGDGPAVCVAPLDLEQEFEPRLKSRMVEGMITTPELDDMFPFLPPEELDTVRRSTLSIR